MARNSTVIIAPREMWAVGQKLANDLSVSYSGHGYKMGEGRKLALSSDPSVWTHNGTRADLSYDLHKIAGMVEKIVEGLNNVLEEGDTPYTVDGLKGVVANYLHAPQEVGQSKHDHFEAAMDAAGLVYWEDPDAPEV